MIAHFHGPSHSSRYLLVVFLVGLADFLVCLLSFLVDVLLFVPHMAWGSYVVLAATILVAISGLVSCAMRRTIVGRKSRQKRIAANPEMSGEAYYNRQAQTTVPPVNVPSTLQQPTVPMLSGANGNNDSLPEFASFDKKDDRSSDERIPLTARSPSNRSPGNFTNDGSNTLVNDATSTSPTDYPPPQRSMSATPGSRGQYGDPMPGQGGYPARTPSSERMNGRGRGGMPPGGYRGRGYPGPGRGGYNGYGTPPPGPGRGGYGSPPRGGYGTPPGVRGGYGPPPRGGYGSPMRGGRPPPPSYPGSQSSYDRRPSPAGPYGQGSYDARPPPGAYGARQQSPGLPSAPGYNQPAGGYNAYDPDRDLPRAESPPPLPGIDDGHVPGHVPSQVVEMDASTPDAGLTQYGIRDDDSDVAGMLALQQGRLSPANRANRHETYTTETSRYSQDEYVFAIIYVNAKD